MKLACRFRPKRGISEGHSSDSIFNIGLASQDDVMLLKECRPWPRFVAVNIPLNWAHEFPFSFFSFFFLSLSPRQLEHRLHSNGGDVRAQHTLHLSGLGFSCVMTST